jgi:hypothetical protein
MLHEHGSGDSATRKELALPATCLGAVSSAKFWTKN